jgi:MFS family permease
MIPSSKPHRLNLGLFSAVIFLFWMSLYLYVPTLPVYAAQVRGAALDVVGLIIASYGFTQLVLRIPTGLWSDQVRRRKVFVVGGLLLATASGLGLALAGNPAMLVVFRGMSGAAAATWVVSSVWLASFYPPQEAVKAAGMASFLSGLGQVLATALGGSIAQKFGWTAPFYVAAGVGALTLIPLAFVREKRQDKKAFAGPKSIFHTLSDRTLLIVSLVTAVEHFAIFATIYGFIPIYAAGLGASRAQLGWLTSTFQLANVVTSIGVGLLVTSRTEKGLALVGLAAVGLSCFWVLRIHTIPMLFLSQALNGLGNGLTYSVLMGLAIKRVASERRALAMGAFQAIYAIGMFSGPTISGWLAKTTGIQSVFWVSGFLALAALPFLKWGLRGYGRNEERRIGVEVLDGDDGVQV